MSRVFPWFGGCLLLVLVSAAATAGPIFIRPGLDAIGDGGYRADRLIVRLKPPAGATARATIASARVAPATHSVEATSLGLAALDRVAASVGIVQFRPEFPGETPPAVGETRTDFTSFYIASLAPGASVEAAVAALRALPDVESADYVAWLRVAAVPNDSLFPLSWWFQGPPGISATSAWDVWKGPPPAIAGSTVIAILDTGVLPWHPDIGGTVAGSSGQIWTNVTEANGQPGVDDDRNGKFDDVHGWDFVDNIPPAALAQGEDGDTEDNDPNDFVGHGTEVAGLAAAITNNGIGVAGASWGATIMPLRVGWKPFNSSGGIVEMPAVAAAILYAARAGAQVINCSFQTDGQVLAAAEEATRLGVLVVSAGGNVGPCPIPGSDCHELADMEGVVAVGASDTTGHIAALSITGEYIDVFAPGTGIRSTSMIGSWNGVAAVRTPTYMSPSNGTSYSAPLAAGTAALLLNDDRAHHRPPLRPRELLFRLRENADAIGSAGTAVSANGAVGLLDAASAITHKTVSFAVTCDATVGAPIGLVTTGTTRVAVLATSTPSLLFLSSRGDTLAQVALDGNVIGSPATADLGGGRGPGIFVALDDGTVAGFDGHGAPLAGWPAATDLGDPPFAGASLGDLDGDGVIEVVCVSRAGQVYVWNVAGARVGPFPVTTDGTRPMGGAALADLDGAPGAEIVVGTRGGNVYAFRANATPLLAGFPQPVGSQPRPPIVMRLGHAGPAAIVTASGSTLTALDAAGTTLFSRPLGGTVVNDLAAGDLDGDGADEIVVPTRAPHAIAAFDSSGLPLAGWPVALPDSVTGPPLVRVTTVDRALTAVVVPCGHKLRAYAPSGLARGDFPKPGHAGDQATIFDLAGDSYERVLASSIDEGLLYFYRPPGLIYQYRPNYSQPDIVTPMDQTLSWATPRGDLARTASRLATPVAGVVNNVPARVLDLAVTAVTSSTATLGWTATGDDSATGRPREYDITAEPVAGGSPIHFIVFATADAGGHESTVVDHLAPSTAYRFSVVARDAQGEQSLPSNSVEATTEQSPSGPIAGLAGPVTAVLAQPSRAPASILWRGGPGMTGQRLSLYDVTGRKRRTYDLGSASEGVVLWNGVDDDGETVESGVYFVLLESGSKRASTRIVLLH